MNAMLRSRPHDDRVIDPTLITLVYLSTSR